MSCEESRKQHIRTQGRYSDSFRNQDKKNKISPSAREEKKFTKRYSNESRKSCSNESSSVTYEKNANKNEFSFPELEEQEKLIQIKDPGKHLISSTGRGESVIYYKPDFIEEGKAWDMFDYFNDTTKWNAKNIVIRGEEYAQPRLVAWYGPYPYSYSGVTLEAEEMPENVIKIKHEIEAYLKEQGINTEFNSVLLNKYRNEKDSVAWHSDDEMSMGIDPTIASISLGEARKFEIRPKMYPQDEDRSHLSEMFMNLTHGSLVIMDGCMQEDWQHRIPKEYHERGIRINLTFRRVFLTDENTCFPKKEFTKWATAASDSTKTGSTGRAMELNDADFPALGSCTKPSSDVKTNTNISDTAEFWDGDASLNDKQKDKFHTLKNSVTCNNLNYNKNIELKSGDKKSDDYCENATALLPDNSIKMESLKSDKNEVTNEWSIGPNLNKQSNERFRRDHNRETEPRLRLDHNKRNGRFARNQNNSQRGTSKQWNREKEWRPDEDTEVPRRKFTQEDKRGWKQQNDRFLQNQNNNAKQEKISHVQNNDGRQRTNPEIGNDNCWSKSVPHGQNRDRRNERGNDLPPRFAYRNNKGDSFRKSMRDKNSFEEYFENDKSASELVKKEDPGYDDGKELSKITLNVAANEFVPKLNKPGNMYDQLPLENLLHCNIMSIGGEDLQNYAKILKCRVLEKIDEFQPGEEDELKFLCAITDGSQNTKNQRLISIRMANIAVDYVDRRNS